MSAGMPSTAMVLAAGLGLRMRPITETMPKPLIPVAGRPLIDWGLDALAAVDVETAVVNVHYLPEQVFAHVRERPKPTVLISDESDELLDSGGGIVKALPKLGSKPFFIINADTFWIDTGESNLRRLALAWRPGEMDILLMLARTESAVGHNGKVDFVMDSAGLLRRAKPGEPGFVYAGAAVADPALFAAAEARPHSLNRYFDEAIGRGGLAGLVLDGTWITVGTPDAIAAAEAEVARLNAPAE